MATVKVLERQVENGGSVWVTGLKTDQDPGFEIRFSGYPDIPQFVFRKIEMRPPFNR